MARVLAATIPAMPVVDDSGNVRPQLPVTLTTLAGAAVPLYSAASGATTEAAVSDAHGLLPGYLDPGTYNMEAGGVTRQIEVVSARSSGIHLEPSGDATGATDSAKLAAAVTALGASGGEVELGAGVFYWLTGPACQGLRSITIRGQGGLSAGTATGTTVIYVGATSPCVDARSTAGFRFADIFVQASNVAFTGTLIDFGHGVAASDSAFGSVERCGLEGTGSCVPGVLISLDKAIGMTLRETRFGRCTVSLRGRTGGTYSNAISVERCYFNHVGGNSSTQAPIQDAGQAWTVKGCFFEPLQDGSAGAYKAVSGQASALTFEGCWFGDANALGTWVDWDGSALIVKGSVLSTGATGIKLPAGGARALLVQGNQFGGMTTAVDLGGASGGNHYVEVFANDFSNCTNDVVYGANLPLGARTHSPIAGVVTETSSTRMRSPAAFVMYERTDPAAPAADQAIVYVRDNGAGKTQLVAEFASGAVQVIATQP